MQRGDWLKSERIRSALAQHHQHCLSHCITTHFLHTQCLPVYNTTYPTDPHVIKGCIKAEYRFMSYLSPFLSIILVNKLQY